MKLTQDQINKTENYLGWLDKGESKTSAAALVGVPRKTISRWQESYEANQTKTKIAAVKPVENKKVEKMTDEFVPFQSISLPNVFTIVRDGAPLQIDKSHQNFAKIKDIISNVKNGQILSSDLEKLYDLIDLKSSLAKFSHGRITVDDTGVKVDGKPLHNSLANILLKSFRDQDAASLTKFAKFHEKIMEAISYKVTHRLFDFVQGQGLRIDDDGDILAFKVVQNNYLDK
ncbi:MAG TPA: helix-turn-helix domain-containing protein, partial [Nitrososphaeraceae archaeon]